MVISLIPLPLNASIFIEFTFSGMVIALREVVLINAPHSIFLTVFGILNSVRFDAFINIDEPIFTIFSACISIVFAATPNNNPFPISPPFIYFFPNTILLRVVVLLFQNM